MEVNQERELSWDEEISNDDPNFVLLPEGEYEYQVISFERARHAGSANLPPCAKAVLKIKIETKDGISKFDHNLFLHTKTQGFLSDFFVSIGQGQKGDKTIKMNWNAVPGSTGRAKVGIDEWEYKGETMQANRIKKFLPPATEKTSPTFEAGRF